MDTKAKSIILFNPHHADSPVFKSRLIDFCTEHFDIIKVIQAKNKHHFKSLRRVIKTAIGWKGNITVITDRETFDLSTNMLTCSVLGTLSLAEVADVCIYDSQYKPNDQIKFKFVTSQKNQGLHTAIHHFRDILACVEERDSLLANSKRAVILIQQPYWHSNKELQQSLVDLCSENNLSVAKVIKSKNNYDASIFYRLIGIINEERRPITVIMAENEYRSVDNILTCSLRVGQ